MIENKYTKIEGLFNVQGIILDGFAGTCSLKDWEYGEGFFIETCKCHPERPGHVIYAQKTKDNGYALYTNVYREDDGSPLDWKKLRRKVEDMLRKKPEFLNRVLEMYFQD